MKIETISLNSGARITAYCPNPEVGYGKPRQRPGILLAPGGAYLIHATREKEGVAIDFLARGFNVYVLEYTIGFSDRAGKEKNTGELDTVYRYPQPLIDLFEAMHWIHQHEDDLNQIPDALFLMGFSAGGHLCAAAGTQWDDKTILSKLSFRPESEELKAMGIILGYPMTNPAASGAWQMSDESNPDTRLMKQFLFDTQTPSQEQMDGLNPTLHVDSRSVPAFIWHSVDDGIVCSWSTTEFVLALQKVGICCEYHLFDHGGHGLALASDVYAMSEQDDDPVIAIWRDLAESWMKRRLNEQQHDISSTKLRNRSSKSSMSFIHSLKEKGESVESPGQKKTDQAAEDESSIQYKPEIISASTRTRTDNRTESRNQA